MAVSLAASMAACGGGEQTGGDSGKELSGAVKIDGSSTVGPLTKAAADLYADQQPKVNVTVGISGTGGGFKKFCANEIDISDASRPISETEKKECEAKGIKYTELLVANDALSLVVSKQNTWADCLTVAQLKQIWEPNSKINNWNQINPSFPNEPLKLFGAGTDSGTFDFFTEVIMGKAKSSRTDYTASENDNVIVQGVSETKGGLGYFGFSYFEENAAKLKVLKIDGGGGCVEPSLTTAQNGSYKPLARPLYIYVKNAAMSQEQVADFVRFYVEEIDNIIKEARFVPLTSEQKTKLDGAYTTLKA